MHLINDLSDLPRFASLLNTEYKQKLTNDINTLLIKYMDEQAKSLVVTNPEKKEINLDLKSLEDNNTEISLDEGIYKNSLQKPAPVFSPPPPITKPVENLYKNNFSGNLNKPNFPPPPPLPQNIGNATSPPKLKHSSLLQRPNVVVSAQKNSPTKFISIFESMGYVLPELTEAGTNAAATLPINSEPSKFLKQVDGSTTLKQVYMIVYPSSVSPMHFIERAMQINLDRNMSFRAAGNVTLPEDTDILFRLGDILIGFGYIDDSLLENALMLQRRDTRNVQGDDELLGYDVAEARKEDNKNLRKDKPLLGDILVDMKAVSQQQIEQALKLQKWYREVIQQVR